MPSDTFKRGLTKAERKTLNPIKLRIIRLTHPDGTLSVLLTHLFDKKTFSCQSVIDLYYRRWAIENPYRDEKVGFEIERFHSKTVNGIQQELFAILIVCVIARVATALAVPSEAVETGQCSKAPQLKNAVKSFAREAAFRVAINPERAFAIFQELLNDIRRVKYYPSHKPKPSKPRINKGAANKWQAGRCKKWLWRLKSTVLNLRVRPLFRASPLLQKLNRRDNHSTNRNRRCKRPHHKMVNA